MVSLRPGPCSSSQNGDLVFGLDMKAAPCRPSWMVLPFCGISSFYSGTGVLAGYKVRCRVKFHGGPTFRVDTLSLSPAVGRGAGRQPQPAWLSLRQRGKNMVIS